MAKYLIVSHFNEGDLSDIDKRSEKVKQAIIEQVPSLFQKWSCKLVTMAKGVQTYDVVDSPSAMDAMKAAALMEKHGRCKTEILPVVDWPDFVMAQAGSK